MSEERHVLITGGAGYIGSVLTEALLRRGYWVTVVDALLFGGESLLAYLPHPAFHFMRADVCDEGVILAAAREAGDHVKPTLTVDAMLCIGCRICEAACSLRFTITSDPTAGERSLLWYWRQI